MLSEKNLLPFLLLLVIVGLLIFIPSRVIAQDTNPPELVVESTMSPNDILVLEPTFHWEFPFEQGFKISFNFSIAFEVPRSLLLLQDDLYNFILEFQSYIIPAGGQ